MTPIAGSAKELTPSVGGAATQASTQLLAADLQGLLSQSGQWLQGSEAVVWVGEALGIAAQASATAGRPDARMARQPRRPARRQKRIVFIMLPL